MNDNVQGGWQKDLLAVSWCQEVKNKVLIEIQQHEDKGSLGKSNFSGVIQVESSFQWPERLNGR